MTNAKPLLIPLPHSIPSPDITSPTSPVANGQSCFTRVPLDKDSLGTSSSHVFRTLSPVTAAKTLAFSHLSKPSYQSAHPSLGHDCSISSTESQSKTSFDQSTYETSELEPDVSNPELESFSNQPPQPEAAGDEGVPAKIQQGKHKQSFFDFSRFKGSVKTHENETTAPAAPPSSVGSVQHLAFDSNVPNQDVCTGSSMSSKKEDPQSRIVYINNPVRTNEKYEMAGNRVHTSKYSLLTFLPRNLFEQFHRFAYIYFLVIVILNQIPALAVFGRTASLFPLVFVLVLTAIKDGYEDWGRHRSDREENMRTSLVLQEGHYKPKKWDQIQVGEMVKLLSNQIVPCDMVLLGSSDPSGVAYVETLNLDGESNLKSRYARQETADKHPESGPISGALICELPNRNIYEFTAYMDLNGVQVPVGPNNIILRGCEVKNTAWVVGVVAYAGRETKAMLNSSGAQSKRSRLEQYMNRETGWLIVFLIVICLVGGFGTALWVQTHLQWLPIIQFYKLTAGDDMFTGVVGEAITAFLSCIIIFQIMIPISLYISMEVVRLGQSYFMIRDMEMYHPASDTPFQCRALNINEDLGQVKYLFSDKTGTLTENKMEFHTASVDGIDYCDASVDPVAGNVEASNRLANLHQVEGSFGIIHTDIMFLTLSCNVLFLILRKQERFC
jgi:phospholipid-transporting ATPase